MSKIKVKIKYFPSVSREVFELRPYLQDYFEFIETDNPDYIVYFDRDSYNRGSPDQIPPMQGPVSILYCGEAFVPNMLQCDWALGWVLDEIIQNSRHLRTPNYGLYPGYQKLIKPANYDPVQILHSKSKFCAFVFWNPVGLRDEFFTRLSAYRRVDAPGRCHHNMPPTAGKASPHAGRWDSTYFTDFVDFLQPYKFAIVMGNKFFRGRTDEKPYGAMQANCLPIFWGNPDVEIDFNTKSFINMHECGIPLAQQTPENVWECKDKMFEYAINEIKRLDQNDSEYIEKLKQPWYPNNQISKFVDPQRIVAFLTKVFTSGHQI